MLYLTGLLLVKDLYTTPQANEPHHDKTNKLTVRQAKTQISLGIRPDWSMSSPCAQWVAKDPRFLHADSEDSDQTGRMSRLIWVFAGRTCHFVCLSWGGSNHLTNICYIWTVISFMVTLGERGGSVVECRTPEREVGGSKPTAAVLCPWARHFTPRKYWLITQEVVAPSRHDWKIVDWDVKPQHKQTNKHGYFDSYA